MRILPLLALVLATGGCAHRDDGLYGSYAIAGEAGGVQPPAPATLEITRPDRYRFCHAERCASGTFRLLPVPNAAEGRITLVGAAVETYVRSVSKAAYGESDIDRQRGTQGLVDLDYRTDGAGATIPLGVGDIAFVRR